MGTLDKKSNLGYSSMVVEWRNSGLFLRGRKSLVKHRFSFIGNGFYTNMDGWFNSSRAPIYVNTELWDSKKQIQRKTLSIKKFYIKIIFNIANVYLTRVLPQGTVLGATWYIINNSYSQEKSVFNNVKRKNFCYKYSLVHLTPLKMSKNSEAATF